MMQLIKTYPSLLPENINLASWLHARLKMRPVTLVGNVWSDKRRKKDLKNRVKGSESNR